MSSQSTPLTPAPSANSEAVRFLGAYYIYQDQIGWSRTQAIAIVELAALAGAFARQGPLSPLPLVLGTMVVCWLHKLALRDWQVRDHIGVSLQPALDPLEVHLKPAPRAGEVRGRPTLQKIVWGIIITNILLAGLMAARLVIPSIGYVLS
jgi:hypothetical protein